MTADGTGFGTGAARTAGRGLFSDGLGGGLELSLDAVYADEVMADAVQHGEAGCPSPVLKGGPSQLVQHGRYT